MNFFAILSVVLLARTLPAVDDQTLEKDMRRLNFPRTEKMAQIESNVNPQIGFQSSVSWSQTSLRVTYSVTNKGIYELYLTNHAVRYEDGRQVPDRKEAFVYLLGSDKAVHITKRRPGMGENLSLLREHFVTPVKPGETYEETIEIPVPVLANDPHRSNPAGRKVIETYRRALFSLGYIPGSPKLQAVVGELNGHMVHSVSPIQGKDGKPVHVGVVEEEFLFSVSTKVAIPVSYNVLG